MGGSSGPTRYLPILLAPVYKFSSNRAWLVNDYTLYVSSAQFAKLKIVSAVFGWRWCPYCGDCCHDSSPLATPHARLLLSSRPVGHKCCGRSGGSTLVINLPLGCECGWALFTLISALSVLRAFARDASRQMSCRAIYLPLPLRRMRLAHTTCCLGQPT